MSRAVCSCCVHEPPTRFVAYPRFAWKAINLGDTTTLVGGCINCDSFYEYTLKAVKITVSEVVFEIQTPG